MENTEREKCGRSIYLQWLNWYFSLNVIFPSIIFSFSQFFFLLFFMLFQAFKKTYGYRNVCLQLNAILTTSTLLIYLNLVVKNLIITFWEQTIETIFTTSETKWPDFRRSTLEDSKQIDQIYCIPWHPV